MAGAINENGPVLHVVVVGFHHKKGCQVEYSYPPLITGAPVHGHDLPAEWKHLPSLALPDGAHRFDKDTVYFHMTSLGESNETVFGVSCYRQMDAKDLINRTSDVTRDTVQKSVCVLSKLPLYGMIEAKLELITHAYFKECDFTQVSLLEETYRNLNASLSPSLLTGSQLYCGLPLREVVHHFKHKIVILFKLMMLERRVLFFTSPVKELTSTILAVLSLFPGMIDRGLTEAASYSPLKQLSPTLKTVRLDHSNEDYLEVQYRGQPAARDEQLCPDVLVTEENSCNKDHHSSKDSMLSDVKSDADSSSHSNSDVTMATNSVLQSVQSVSNEAISVSAEKLVDSFRKHSVEDSAVATEINDDKAGTVVIKRADRVIKREHSESDILDERRKKGKALIISETDEDCLADERDVDQLASAESDVVFSGQPVLGNIQPVTLAQTVQHMESMENDSSILGKSQRERNSSSASYPLEFVEDITAIQSVQTLDHVKGSGIKDLDDPDEIQQIDREDCFSWEEDKLFLEIKDQSAESHSLRSSNTMENISLTSDSPATTPANQNAEKNILEIGLDTQQTDKQTDSGIETDGNFDNKLIVNMNPPSPPTPTTLEIDECGLPLSIFTKGCLCHPYLALQFFDLLQDVNVRGFVIGATNILFKQKRHLTDVIVEVDEPRLDIQDNELKRQLHLTTADLRFAEYIVRSISDDKGDVFLDDTSWEGGADWLRSQFRLYLLSLMSTTILDDEKLIEDFNPFFVSAWKSTHNYKIWRNTVTELETSCTGHPFHGQLSMTDMKLRLSHTIQNTERGKKINAAVQKTGTIVAQTGKVVGGALTQAKSAVSSWFSSFTTEKQSPKHSPKLQAKNESHTVLEQPEALE